MNKVIIVCEDLLKPDDRERMEQQIKHDLEQNGFVLLDSRFKVYKMDEDEED